MNILKSLGINNYKIREDGGIVVLQDVHWEGKDFETIPVKFYSVDGDFNVKGNKLESLENFPQFITGTATVSYNKLKSFEGIPKDAIMLGLVADNNFLTTLEGAPKHVDTFSIDNNSLLTTLLHAPAAKKAFCRGLPNVSTSEIVLYTRAIILGTWESDHSILDNFKATIRKAPSQLEDKIFYSNTQVFLDLVKDELRGTLNGVKYGL